MHLDYNHCLDSAQDRSRLVVAQVCAKGFQLGTGRKFGAGVCRVLFYGRVLQSSRHKVCHTCAVPVRAIAAGAVSIATGAAAAVDAVPPGAPVRSTDIDDDTDDGDTDKDNHDHDVYDAARESDHHEDAHNNDSTANKREGKLLRPERGCVLRR